MENPYEINPTRFILRRLGPRKGYTVFIVQQGDEGALAMCMYRDHLVRFLMDELEGPWHVRNFQNNLEVSIAGAFDIQRVRDNFRLV